MVPLFDSHAHLSDDLLFSEAEELCRCAEKEGLVQIINIATDLITLERGISLLSKSSLLGLAAALPPHDAAEEDPLYDSVCKAVERGVLRAIGETGLDYHYHAEGKELQKKVFTRYIALAEESALPLVIHCRDAFDDLFLLLDRFPRKEERGVIHCFTGSLEEALQAINRGFYISFSGIVTFKKSEALREVARQLPLDRILIETDAPFLAPQPHRGKVNQPAWVVEVAKSLADTRGEPFETVARQTTENGQRLFG